MKQTIITMLIALVALCASAETYNDLPGSGHQGDIRQQ